MAPTAPYVALPLVNGGNVNILPSQVTACYAVPGQAAQSFVQTSGGGDRAEPYLVALSPDAVTLALAGGTSTAGNGDIVFAGIFVGATGLPLVPFYEHPDFVGTFALSRVVAGQYALACSSPTSIAGVLLASAGNLPPTTTSVGAGQAGVNLWGLQVDVAGVGSDPPNFSVALIRIG